MNQRLIFGARLIEKVMSLVAMTFPTARIAVLFAFPESRKAGQPLTVPPRSTWRANFWIASVLMATCVLTLAPSMALAQETKEEVPPLFYLHRQSGTDGGVDYTVKVYPDGRVVYHGLFNQKKLGVYQRTLSSKALDEFVAALEKTQVFEPEFRRQTEAVRNQYEQFHPYYHWSEEIEAHLRHRSVNFKTFWIGGQIYLSNRRAEKADRAVAAQEEALKYVRPFLDELPRRLGIEDLCCEPLHR